MTFVNEDPIQIPGCPDVVCDYDDLMLAWQPIVDNSDMESICRPVEDSLVLSSKGFKINPYLINCLFGLFIFIYFILLVEERKC